VLDRENPEKSAKCASKGRQFPAAGAAGMEFV